MNQVHHFTDEEKAELLSNPFTFQVTDCKITFTLAFKQLVLDEINKPGMSAAKIFQKAGYRLELFPGYRRRYYIRQIRQEAASEKGLQEPKPSRRKPPVKKHVSSQIKELEERILILEQQLNFLKKSRHLRTTGMLPPDNTD
jgi:hypothetical protein